MRRLFLTLLTAATVVVMVMAAAPAVTQAQTDDAPYGYYPETSHRMCPPLEGYKWPDSKPPYGKWSDTAEYNNHTGDDFGCRTQRAEQETPETPFGAPTIRVDGNTISWDAVGQAEGYNVYRNGGYLTTVVSEASYNATQSGSYYLHAFDRDTTPTRFSSRSNEVDVGDSSETSSGNAPVKNTNATFEQHRGTPSSELSADQDGLTTYLGNNSTGAPCDLSDSDCRRWDDGPEPNGGNFRVTCQYSHFNYDDPIVEPGNPGTPDSDDHHLHMFFGNTTTDAFTSSNSDDPNFVARSGGGSCNGFALNRSAYWTPALLDGKGNAVVPFQIVAYYKTLAAPGTSTVDAHVPADVVDMPQGLQLVAGNTPHADDNFNGDSSRPSYNDSELTFWSCGFSGAIVDGSKQSEIPSDCGDQPINATIYFPQCWDGEHLTPYTNDAGQEISHVKQARYGSPCPEGYESRLPQLGILMYFAPQSTDGWRLASDHGAAAGSTLHADWFGGWHTGVMNNWSQSCVRTSRNCSFGQTGKNRTLTRLDQGAGYQDDEYGLKSNFRFTGERPDNGRTYSGTFGDLNQYLVPISEVDYPGK